MPLHAAALQLVTSPPSETPCGVALTPAPTVQLIDQNGTAYSQGGVEITVSIASGGGAVYGALQRTTDDQGRATFVGLELGGALGSRTLEFASSGLTPVVSDVINLSAGAASVALPAFSTPIHGIVNTPVSDPPAVLVKDPCGNPVSGVPVTFSVEPGNGSVTGTSQTTNSLGIATVGSWTLPTRWDDYILSAEAIGTTLYFHATALPDVPAWIFSVGSGQEALYGSVLPDTLQAQVFDKYNNRVPNVTVDWTVTDGKGTITPASSGSGSGGIATATFRLDTIPDGANSVRATISGQNVTADFTFKALGFAAVVVAPDHTCAVDDKRVGYCWGHNDSGQLGDNTLVDRSSPTPVAGSLRFGSLSAGMEVTCGSTAEYEPTAYCWGSNTFGALGDGTQTTRLVPTPVSGGLHLQFLVTGGQVSCGIIFGMAGGTYCWGDDSAGQLGVGATVVQTCISALGNPDFPCSRVPVQVQGGMTFSWLSASAAHVCGLELSSNALYCWGTSSNFGGGSSSGIDPAPVRVGGGMQFNWMSAGGAHTCGTVGAGVFCWGNETQYGVIGDGLTNTTQTTPVMLAQFTGYEVNGGLLGTCEIEMGGIAYCWGYNQEGGVGDGTTTTRTTPVLVNTTQRFNDLRTSGHHACGLNTARQLYCWGWNRWGQLGVGNFSNQLTPTLVRR